MEYNIGIVIGEFYQEITKKMEHLIDMALKSNSHIKVDIFKVPGAVEIPLITKKLALNKKYDAVIMLGVVIRGETTHYDYVCQQVSYGCQKIALETLKPIIFGILTCENIQQVQDRLDGKKGNKVQDMFDTAVKMIELTKKL